MFDDEGDQEGRVLIFGSSGFIGRHLLNSLNSNGTGREAMGFDSSNANLLDSRTIACLRPRISRRDTVIFLVVNKVQSGADLGDFESNTSMVINFCRVIEQTQPRRLVYFSSQAVFGEDKPQDKLSEDVPASPTSLYGLAKSMGEQLFAMTVAPLSTKLLVIRIPRVYGPGACVNDYGPNQFLQDAKMARAIELWGDGKEKRPFLYVGDLTRALGELLRHDDIGGVLNLAPPCSSTFLEAAEEAKMLTGSKAGLIHRERTRAKVHHVTNITQWRRLFPNFEFTGLHEAMRQTLRAMG